MGDLAGMPDPLSQQMPIVCLCMDEHSGTYPYIPKGVFTHFQKYVLVSLLLNKSIYVHRSSELLTKSAKGRVHTTNINLLKLSIEPRL